MLNTYSRTLSCGTLKVTPTGGTIALDELFDVAERRNPKRAFLFVSKVLGRHIPVKPSVMRAVYQQLAALFPACDQGPVLFIGMAETAVGFGAGVFDEVRGSVSDPVYLTSTRHPVEGVSCCANSKKITAMPPTTCFICHRMPNYAAACWKPKPWC